VKPNNIIIPAYKVESKILLLRDQKVIIDRDLADFYGVDTKRLNEQVKRNIKRFPVDFMFQLTQSEKNELVANCDHLNNLKYSKALPCAFTEHGIIMVASVLNSNKTIEVGVFITRIFVKMRQLIIKKQELQQKIVQIEEKLSKHDNQLVEIKTFLQQLLNPKPKLKTKKIGFLADISDN
jgi:hypothetical protein